MREEIIVSILRRLRRNLPQGCEVSYDEKLMLFDIRLSATGSERIAGEVLFSSAASVEEIARLIGEKLLRTLVDFTTREQERYLRP